MGEGVVSPNPTVVDVIVAHLKELVVMPRAGTRKPVTHAAAPPAAAVEAATQPPPQEAPAVDLAALIQDFTTAVLAKVDARLEQVEQRVSQHVSQQLAAAQPAPQFVPMQVQRPDRPEDVAPFKGLGQFTGQGNGFEERQGSTTLPTVNGMDPMYHGQLLQTFKQQWRVGSTVRINPEASREGFPTKADGTQVTWGDLLPKVKNNPLGIGTVTKHVFLRRTGHHKYFVHVPGLTQGPPGQNNDGFDDYELLPYTPPAQYLS